MARSMCNCRAHSPDPSSTAHPMVATSSQREFRHACDPFRAIAPSLAHGRTRALSTMSSGRATNWMPTRPMGLSNSRTTMKALPRLKAKAASSSGSSDRRTRAFAADWNMYHIASLCWDHKLSSGQGKFTYMCLSVSVRCCLAVQSDSQGTQVGFQFSILIYAISIACLPKGVNDV